MSDTKSFRMYAEECRRLAAKMPEHRTALLEMAEAWLACAKAAEGSVNGKDHSEA